MSTEGQVKYSAFVTTLVKPLKTTEAQLVSKNCTRKSSLFCILHLPTGAIERPLSTVSQHPQQSAMLQAGSANPKHRLPTPSAMLQAGSANPKHRLPTRSAMLQPGSANPKHRLPTRTAMLQAMSANHKSTPNIPSVNSVPYTTQTFHERDHH